ncbi:MAG: TonB-dependent receptor plug domain-containing protein [Terriglobia bacterium]
MKKLAAIRTLNIGGAIALWVLVMMAWTPRTGQAAASQTAGKLRNLFTRHAAHKKQKAKPAAKAKRRRAASLSKMSLADLGTIKVISVSKEPEEVWQTPAAIFVLTQEDIRRSGATSIPEVLRLVPGVEVARIDSDHWAVGVRGFNSQFSKSVLVLIDGRSVYTPLFAGVYWDVQNLPLEDIDRIEVIRGPGGSIWGANAVNAVINIITKNTKDTHGALLALGGGNVDQGTGEFRYGGGNGRGFNYRVYGMGFLRGPEFHLDHDPFDAWETGQAGFRTDWDPAGGDSFMLEGSIYDEDEGERDTIATYSPPAQSSVDMIGEASGGHILGRWKRELGEGSDIQLQGYFDRTNRVAPGVAGETRDTYDVDFLHHLTLAHHQNFIWGLGARLSPSDFTQMIPTFNFIPQHQTDEIYSGFAQDGIPLIENQLWLTLGSKLEHNNYTGFEVEPTARLLWTPGPRQSVWAAVSRAVRTPSRLDEDLELTGLYSTNPLPIYVRIAANGGFFSEELISYEAGYRSLIRPKLYLDVAAFHNDYNYLSAYGLGSAFAENSPPPLRIVLAFPYVNGIEGTTSGFELSPDWKPRHWWQLKGSYSFLHMDLRRRPGNLDMATALADEGSSPSHEMTIQSLFNLPKHFEFDQTYRYVGALADVPSYPAPVPAYGTADLRLGWRPNSHLEFSLAGQNLLQPQHMEFAGSDPGLPVEVKRSVYGKVTMRW